MGNAQSYVVSSLAACSIYLVYIHIFRSHKLLRTRVLDHKRLPSFVYLYIRYLSRAVSRRRGCLIAAGTKTREVIYTVLDCRLDTTELRRFCSAAGYGWDYPDTEYRDIPLCFPEFLCQKLLLMVLTDGDFRLTPAGLVRVRQTLKTLEPVDELKKGPFTLQVGVQEYRHTQSGVEVDVCLSATARTGRLVWESVLTLLSTQKPLTGSRCSVWKERRQSQTDECVPGDVKQVELRVPRTTGLHSVWSFSDVTPYHLLSLPARLFGCRANTSPSLWMLSVCLAEIEKHKGVGVITAPTSVSAQFDEPLLEPGRVTIRFWEMTSGKDQSSGSGLGFSMKQHGGNMSHMTGLISKSLVPS